MHTPVIQNQLHHQHVPLCRTRHSSCRSMHICARAQQQQQVQQQVQQAAPPTQPQEQHGEHSLNRAATASIARQHMFILTPATLVNLVRAPVRLSSCHDGLVVAVPIAGSSSSSSSSSSNPLVTGLVSAMTESLRLLGVGKQQYQDIAMQPSPNPPLGPGMTQELVERLTADFQRAYFVTGLIDDSIYDPNCTFVDPTIKFSGVDLWKRNLQLLVPFLVQPRIKLYSTEIRPTSSPPEVEAVWQLSTWLSLPWKPYVEIEGKTVYTLSTDANQVVRHEEFWNVSPVAALLMMFRPGPPVPAPDGHSQ